MTWELDGRPLRSVLVTRLRYLGDIVMSTVVLTVLRRGDPHLDLGYLCEAAYGPVLVDQPDLDRVHLLQTRRRSADARARVTSTDQAGEAAGGGTLATIVRLRRARYDAAIDLFFNPRSAWLLALGGARARIGGATGSRRRLYTHLATARDAAPKLADVATGGLADHLARLAPLRHVESGLAALDWLMANIAPGTLAPTVIAPALGRGAAAAALAAAGVTDGAYTLLAPTATWPTKEWPRAHWRELAARLTALGLGPVVALAAPGGESDAPGVPGTLPPLPLTEALKVVARAARVVSVDGGVMHAAVGMGVPTVALFGPTDPAIWFPYETLGPFRVLATRPACWPCHRHTCDAFVCLPDLEPARIAAAVAALPGQGART